MSSEGKLQKMSLEQMNLERTNQLIKAINDYVEFFIPRFLEPSLKAKLYEAYKTQALKNLENLHQYYHCIIFDRHEQSSSEIKKFTRRATQGFAAPVWEACCTLKDDIDLSKLTGFWEMYEAFISYKIVEKDIELRSLK